MFRKVTVPLLAPTLLFLGVMTTIGYFQFFAEPYVMTGGGRPLNATLSVGLLMYKNGFRWWSMGYAAAIAFVLFLVVLGLTPMQFRLQRGQGRVKKLLAAVPVHAALLVGAAVALTPLVWMVSASIMQPGEASEFPPPFLPSSPTLANYVELFTRLSLGRALANSLLVAGATTLGVLLLNSMAGYAFAKLRFRGRDRLFPCSSRRSSSRRRSRCCRSS